MATILVDTQMYYLLPYATDICPEYTYLHVPLQLWKKPKVVPTLKK